MKMRNIKYTVLGLCASMLLFASCYKEDTSELYSRQYELTEEIGKINDEIAQINKDIINLKELYNKLLNKPIVTSYEYKIVEKDGVKDTLGVNINIDGKQFYIPFGRTPLIQISKDGYWIINGEKTNQKAEGKTPEITISVDGYWVIDGIKTTHKAQGENGKTPVITISSDGYWVIDGVKTEYEAVGKAPLISASKDSANPSDNNYYWTVKYPGDTEYKFILDNGQKVKATGPKGEDGVSGAPTVEPLITTIQKSGDNTYITITTKDGDSYDIPLAGISFSLKTTGLLTEEPGTEYIYYDAANKTIDVPYFSTDNVKRIEAILPAGWAFTADISTNPAERIIHITSPSGLALETCQTEGIATFIAFDQEGKSISQYVKLKMKRILAFDLFFNPLRFLQTASADSPFNKLKYSKDHSFLAEFYKLENTNYKRFKVVVEGKPDNDLDESLLFRSPLMSEEITNDMLGHQYILNTFIYKPDSVSVASLVGKEADPEGRVLFPNEYSGDAGYMKPIPYETYFKEHIYTIRNGCMSETIRLNRAASKIHVEVAKASEFLGVPKEDFDVSKVAMIIQNHLQFLSVATKGYNLVSYAALSNTMTYDKSKDRLYCTFCTLGAGNNANTLYLYYDKQAKQRCEKPYVINFVPSWGWDVTYYLNESRIPAPGYDSFDNLIVYLDHENGQEHYRVGQVRSSSGAMPNIY